MSVAVEAQGLRFAFEDHLVLENIHVDVKAGEISVILGSSGSGKSTLLRLLAGLMKTTQGHIQFSKARYQKAFVFQEPSLLPWLTIEQNILLAHRFSKTSKPQDDSPNLTPREQCAEICEVVNLKGHEHKYPRELSGGMKMRASFGRALMAKPDLLFLDEPFSALDEITRWDLQDWLRGWQKSHQISIFLVTHSLSEAALLADQIFLLGQQGEPIKARFRFETAVERDSDNYHHRLHDLKSQILPLLSQGRGRGEM